MKHIYHPIQGWSSFIFLYGEEVRWARDGAVFVEIGAWKGKSTAYMAVEIINSDKNIEFHTVDTFEGSDEPVHHADPVVREGRLEEVFRENIAPVAEHVIVHVGDSSDYAAAFADESVDFIFVDGAHTYEGVSKDLEAWWPKLKMGKRIAGDDWRWKSVHTAVEDFFGPDADIEITPNGKHWWLRKT